MTRTIRGHELSFDSEDFPVFASRNWVPQKGRHTFYAVARKYCPTKKKCVTTYFHRAVKKALPGVQVDHRDGNGLNCCKENLRSATNAQNHAGKMNRPAHFASPFRGVYFHGQNKNWCAQIKVNYKKKHLGSFVTQEEAARAYDEAATKLFGEFAQLNFSKN